MSGFELSPLAALALARELTAAGAVYVNDLPDVEEPPPRSEAYVGAVTLCDPNANGDIDIECHILPDGVVTFGPFELDDIALEQTIATLSSAVLLRRQLRNSQEAQS